MMAASDAGDTEMTESISEYNTPPAIHEVDSNVNNNEDAENEEENDVDADGDEDDQHAIDMDVAHGAGDDDNQDAIDEDESNEIGGEEGGPQSAQSERRTYRKRQGVHRDLDLIRHPPQFVGGMRQTLFELAQPVELKPDEFDKYWPYVDNVWVRQHRAGHDRTGLNSTDYFACRLQRPTYTPKGNKTDSASKTRRNKKAREGGTCQVRIKTMHYQGEFEKVTVMRVGSHRHSHDIDAIDQLKRNSIIMDIARTEVMKGYMPGSVFNAMRQDPERLRAIGGKFMRVSDVRNASQVWRSTYKLPLKSHPAASLSHTTYAGSRQELSIRDAEVPALAASGSAEVNQVEASILPRYQNELQISTTPSASDPEVKAADTAQSNSLPPDTLFFPPPNAYFLYPYLPPFPPPTGGDSPLPHVTLTYAASLDSFLAIDHSIPTPISSLPTKAMTHYLRSRHDAILIGVGTAICDDPQLNCRLAGAGGYGGVGWSSHPRPVIIDPGARWDLNPSSRVLQAAKAGRGRAPWIVVQPTATVPSERIELLQKYGGKFVMLPETDSRFRLRWNDIFRALWEEGIRSVMVEGGAHVASELLGWEENRRLVTTVILTIAPTYLGMGGVQVGPPRSFDSHGRPVAALRFTEVRWSPLGDDIVMCGRMPGNRDRGVDQSDTAATAQTPSQKDAAIHQPNSTPVAPNQGNVPNPDFFPTADPINARPASSPGQTTDSTPSHPPRARRPRGRPRRDQLLPTHSTPAGLVSSGTGASPGVGHGAGHGTGGVGAPVGAPFSFPGTNTAYLNAHASRSIISPDDGAVYKDSAPPPSASFAAHVHHHQGPEAASAAVAAMAAAVQSQTHAQETMRRRMAAHARQQSGRR